ELRIRLVRALSFTGGRTIGVADVFPAEPAETIEPAEENDSSNGSTLNNARADAERQRIVEVLRVHRGRVGRAAQSLGVSRVTLWAKMKRLDLAAQAFSADRATVSA